MSMNISINKKVCSKYAKACRSRDEIKHIWLVMMTTKFVMDLIKHLFVLIISFSLFW